MKCNQTSRNSRRFLAKGGRLFWLGFLFPCLGMAQDLNETADSAVNEEQQEAQIVREQDEGQKDSVQIEEEAVVIDVQQEEQTNIAAEEEQQEAPRVVLKRSSAKPSMSVPQKEEPMAHAGPTEGSREIGVQVPAPGPECYSEPEEKSCSSSSPVLPSAPAKGMCLKNRDCWPAPTGSLTLEFLYFKGIVENLYYGVKAPPAFMNPTVMPDLKNISPKFSYEPGLRINLGATIDNYWEVAGTWMYYKENTDPQVINTTNNGIYTSLVSPAPATAVNYEAQDVVGNWKMWMNVFNLEFKKPFCIGKSLMINPAVGVQGAIYQQYFHAHYTFTVAAVDSPLIETAKGYSRTWGVGPEAAIEVRFLAERRLDLFLRVGYSGMLGQVKAKTVYSDIVPINTMAVATGVNRIGYVINTQIFSMTQVMAAVSKRWEVGKGLFEVMLGWETQFWTGMNRWMLYSNLSSPGNGGNFMLSGPFGRVVFDF